MNSMLRLLWLVPLFATSLIPNFSFGQVLNTSRLNAPLSADEARVGRDAIELLKTLDSKCIYDVFPRCGKLTRSEVRSKWNAFLDLQRTNSWGIVTIFKKILDDIGNESPRLLAFVDQGELTKKDYQLLLSFLSEDAGTKALILNRPSQTVLLLQSLGLARFKNVTDRDVKTWVSFGGVGVSFGHLIWVLMGQPDSLAEAMVLVPSFVIGASLCEYVLGRKRPRTP